MVAINHQKLVVHYCHTHIIWFQPCLPKGNRFPAPGNPGNPTAPVQALRYRWNPPKPMTSLAPPHAEWALGQLGIGEVRSMGWFKGKSTGNHRFSHEIWDFPVIFPLNQSIDKDHSLCIPALYTVSILCLVLMERSKNLWPAAIKHELDGNSPLHISTCRLEHHRAEVLSITGLVGSLNPSKKY